MIELVPLALFAGLVLPFPQEATTAGADVVSQAELEMEPVAVPLRGGGELTVEHGSLVVPIVRSKPASKKIQVDVWRFPADEGADPNTPPIFRLHGGPGWGGIEMDEVEGFYDDNRTLTSVAELVVVGQRGIGTSTPNTVCESSAEYPEDATPEERDAALVKACADCRAHWEAQGYDLSGFNVIEAAADVDDVRRLLGYEKVTLWGGSFGSHWGMATMRFFPDGVARAVLTGMEGPDHTYDMPSGVLASLERLAGEAELASNLIEHIPEEGLIEGFKGVIADVENEPVEVEVRNPDTGEMELVRFEADDIRSLALGYTGRVNSRRGAPTWPSDIIALCRGEFEEAARVRLQRGDGRGGLPTASFFMLDCGSGISPARLKELQTDPAAEVVGDLGHWYQTSCQAWGADLGNEFRGDFETDIPTVIVHGTWDVNTPFDNALECLDFFSDGHFVVVDGGSHGALGEAMDYSNDFREALQTFAATGDRSKLPDEIRMPPIAWAPPR